MGYHTIVHCIQIGIASVQPYYEKKRIMSLVRGQIARQYPNKCRAFMVNYLAHLKIIFGRLGYSLESQNVIGLRSEISYIILSSRD